MRLSQQEQHVSPTHLENVQKISQLLPEASQEILSSSSLTESKNVTAIPALFPLNFSGKEFFLNHLLSASEWKLLLPMRSDAWENIMMQPPKLVLKIF